MSWQVSLRKHAKKQADQLPNTVYEALRFLIKEMKKFGPLRYDWKNFSKLRNMENSYHCHLKSGKPTYVACWEVTDKKIKIIEVYYVGTHEKAPY